MIKTGDRVRWNNPEVWCDYGTGGTVIATWRSDVITDRYRRRGNLIIKVQWDTKHPKTRSHIITHETERDLQVI